MAIHEEIFSLLQRLTIVGIALVTMYSTGSEIRLSDVASFFKIPISILSCKNFSFFTFFLSDFSEFTRPYLCPPSLPYFSLCFIGFFFSKLIQCLSCGMFLAIFIPWSASYYCQPIEKDAVCNRLRSTWWTLNTTK